jgi:dTDP-4-dehydrorhamnose reductase
MKILITGANGQLGQELMVVFKDSKHQLVALSHKDLDISNVENVANVLADIKPAIVINCAAYTAVDKAETESLKAYDINEKGAKNLAITCKKNSIKLIHISTDFVFDGRHSTPYVEIDSTNPLSVYGKSKLAGELVIQKENTASIIIRTSWLYSSFGANFLKTIVRLCGERDELGIVADQIGSPTYAYDLAIAIKSICESPNLAASSGVFHFSNQGVASWYDFAVCIANNIGAKTKIAPITTSQYPTPAIRPHFSVLNTAKIKSTFDISIPHWQASVSICIKKLV